MTHGGPTILPPAPSQTQEQLGRHPREPDHSDAQHPKVYYSEKVLELLDREVLSQSHLLRKRAP